MASHIVRSARLTYDALMKYVLSLGLLLTLAIGASGVVAQSGPGCRLDPGLSGGPLIVRTDHRPTGNRSIDSCGLMEPGRTVDVELGAVPTWVLPDPAAAGEAWLVALQDGTIVRVLVGNDGTASVGDGVVARLDPGEPPMVVVSADGEVEITSVSADAAPFDAPIPHARVVSIDAGLRAVLSGPTDRYPHGVLGDGIEASGVNVRAEDEEEPLVDVGTTSVIEGLSPIVSDLDGDQVPELLVTVSDMYEGAMLAAYDLDGRRIASSEPIGRGFRWLHQIGVGATGPNGEVEIIAVRTPHIGGVVEAYRFDSGRLKRIAMADGYRSHQLGSPNLDMALLADVDGDGQLDVVVPTQDMTSLAVLTRSGDGFTNILDLPLDAQLATNVAANADEGGWLQLAVGTADGRLRIFR